MEKTGGTERVTLMLSNSGRNVFLSELSFSKIHCLWK